MINSVYLFRQNIHEICTMGGSPFIILGLFILAAGVIFHLQGQSVVGPESSFMYSNPDWISYGLGISMAGIIVIGIGFMSRKKSK